MRPPSDLAVPCGSNALARALSQSELPAGMRSDYPAADFDPRLTQQGATAMPLITALDQFRQANGRCPAQLGELSSILPGTGTQAPGSLPNQFGEWYYYPREDGSAYRIGCKLGWDTSLGLTVYSGKRQ